MFFHNPHSFFDIDHSFENYPVEDKEARGLEYEVVSL